MSLNYGGAAFFAGHATPWKVEVLLGVLGRLFGLEWRKWRPATDFYMSWTPIIGTILPPCPWGYSTRIALLQALEAKDICCTRPSSGGHTELRLTPLGVYIIYRSAHGAGRLPIHLDGTEVPIWEDLDAEESKIRQYVQEMLD